MIGRASKRPVERRSKTVDEWPAPDRSSWLAALRPGDVFDEGGDLSHCCELTIGAIRKGYGRWLSWLDSCELLDEVALPGERITPARVRAYVAALQMANASGTIITRLAQLKRAAKVIDPRQNWSWIDSIAASVRSRHSPARPKRDRIVGAGVLFDLGLDLMVRSDSESIRDWRLNAYRDGLLIALLASRPLRMRNLAGLALNRTLVRRGELWWIEISPADTKNREPIEVPWPDALGPNLAHYLSEIRPFLAVKRGRWTRPAGDALWLSSHGSPMTHRAIYTQVIARTRAALGRPINPHLFRDCVATSIAIEDPTHVGIASQLLGHRRGSTTERNYNQARAVEASRQFQAFLVSLRESRGKLLEERE